MNWKKKRAKFMLLILIGILPIAFLILAGQKTSAVGPGGETISASRKGPTTLEWDATSLNAGTFYDIVASTGGKLSTGGTEVKRWNCDEVLSCSAEHSSLTCGTRYYYELYHINEALHAASQDTDACPPAPNQIPSALSVSNSGNENSSITVTANASDEDGTISSYQWYSGNNCAVNTGGILSGQAGSSYTLSAQNDPTSLTYSYKARDNDSAWSNCATATATWNNLPPTASASGGSTTAGSSITFSGSAADQGGEGTPFTYRWYSDNTCTTFWAGGQTFTRTKNTAGTETYYLRVEDADHAAKGNGLSACVSATGIWTDAVAQDTTPPSTTDNWIDAWTSASPVSITLTSGSDASGIDRTEYCVSTSNNCTPATVGTAVSVTCGGGSICTQYVRYRSVDGAGNIETTKSKRVRQDRRNPTGSISVANGAAATNNRAVTLNLTCSDMGSSCANMAFSNNGTTYGSQVTYSATHSWTLTTGDGSKTVRAKFYDAVGNVSSVYSDSITLDTVAPTVPAPSDQGTWRDSTSLTFRGTPEGSTLSSPPGVASCVGQIRRDSTGGTVVFGSGGGLSVGTDGDYTYTGGIEKVEYFYKYKCTDNAGNTSAWSSWTNGISVDTDAPTRPKPTRDNGAVSEVTSIGFSANPSDGTGNVSGISNCYGDVRENGTIIINNTSVGTDPDYNYTGVDGRNYEYRYYCTDNAGNTALDSLWSDITTIDVPDVDTTPPVTTDDWADNWTNAATVTITLTATDSSTISYTRYCVDTSDTCTPGTNGTSVSVSCSSGNHCTQYVRYRSQDVEGNTEDIRSKTVRQDRVSPTTQITSPNAGTWKRSNFSVSINDGDSAGGSGVAVCKERAYSGTQPGRSDRTPCPDGSVSVDVASECAVEGADTCTVQARAKDAAGNWSTERTRTFSIDKTAPTRPAPTAQAQSVGSAVIEFRAAPTDGTAGEVSGISNCWANIRENNSVVVASAVPVGSNADYDYTGTNGKTYDYQYYCTDNAGNTSAWSAWSNDVSIPDVDTTPPVTTDDWADNWTNAATVTITLTATDSSTISYTRYCVDTSDTCTPGTNGTSVSVSCSSGNHCTQYVRYRSQDVEGNTEDIRSKTVRQDRVSPTTQITSPNAGTWKRSNFSVSINDGDSAGGSGVAVCKERAYSGTQPGRSDRTPCPDGSVSVDVASECAVEGADTCTVQARAKDAAGNWSTESTRTFSIDKTAPTRPNPTNDDGATSEDLSISFSANPSDGTGNVSGISTCYGDIRENGTIIINNTNVGSGADYTYTGVDGRSYEYRYYCVDNAGNSSAESVWSGVTSIEVPPLDTTGPTVQTPTDQGAYRNSTSLTFTGSASDPSGVASCVGQVDVNNTDGAGLAFDGGTDVSVLGTKTFTSAANGSTYYYRYKCTDSAPDPGPNTSGWSNWSDGITVDTSDPSTSITAPPAGSPQAGDFIVSFSDSDSISGLDSCEYRILDNGAQALGWSSRSCNGTKTIDVSIYCQTLGGNVCRVETRATDNVGNSRSRGNDYSRGAGAFHLFD